MYTNGLKDRYGSPLISKNEVDRNYAHLNHLNTFTQGLNIYPVDENQDTFIFSIKEDELTKTGKLMLLGIQFSIGDEWNDQSLKINTNSISLGLNGNYSSSLVFNESSNVEFKSITNGEVIYDFQSWMWHDENKLEKSNIGNVQILKNDASEILEKSVLNKKELDTIYAKINSQNIFSEDNTFEKNIEVQNGVNVSGGNVNIADGVIIFQDYIDGTVIEQNGVSGYLYKDDGLPINFNNGIIYDIGEITNDTNMSKITFSNSGKLVQTCEVWFFTGSTVPTTHKWPNDTYWIDSATGAAPTLLPDKNYRIVFRQEPNKIIASIAYLY